MAFTFESEKLVPFLQAIARYLTDDPSHKLIPAKEATGIAFQQGIAREELPNSVPWYICKTQAFQEKGVEIPSIYHVKFLRMGPPVRFAEHGLYRKNPAGGEDDILPIVFEPEALNLIQGKPEYLVLKGDAKRLSSLMNQTYFAPSEPRLRFLIEKFESFCLAKRTGQPIVNVPDISALAVPQVEPAEGWTKTQMAELFRASLQQTGEILEAIRAIVSFVVVLFIIVDHPIIISHTTGCLFPCRPQTTRPSESGIGWPLKATTVRLMATTVRLIRMLAWPQQMRRMLHFCAIPMQPMVVCMPLYLGRVVSELLLHFWVLPQQLSLLLWCPPILLLVVPVFHLLCWVVPRWRATMVVLWCPLQFWVVPRR